MKKTIITRYDDTPYLVRYTLFSCPLFSIKLHKILSSDDACLHDHPWAFISIILKGGYIEHSDKKPKGWDAMALPQGSMIRRSKWYGRGSILFRRASWAHRLELVGGHPATTLVITFRKKRPWGFFTPKGWIFWKNYRQGENTCE